MGIMRDECPYEWKADTMNMEELYEGMKGALRSFDLHFREKGRVRVSIKDGKLVFTCQDERAKRTVEMAIDDPET